MSQHSAIAKNGQCTATSHASGERCKQPCLPGKRVCHYHGGRAGRPHTTGARLDNTKPFEHNFYSKVLTGRSKEFYEYAKTDPNKWSDEAEINGARAAILVLKESVHGDMSKLSSDDREYILRVESYLHRCRNAKRVNDRGDQGLAETIRHNKAQEETNLRAVEQIIQDHVGTINEGLVRKLAQYITDPDQLRAAVADLQADD